MFDQVVKVFNWIQSLARKVPDVKINLAANVFKKIKKALLNKISEGSRINLMNNEVKGIIKVVRSLENRRILLKGATRKIASKEGGFLNF